MRTKTDKIFLFIILFAGLIVRLIWCTGYFFEDESVIFWDVMNFLRNRTYMPVHFNYPTLFSYISVVPIGFTAVSLKLLGVTPSFAGIEAFYDLYPLRVMFPVRLVSVVLGMATLYIAYYTGKRFFDEKTGLVACAFLAFSPLHIERSALALPDIAMTFFSALVVFYSLPAMQSRSPRCYALAGFFAGLATATKYNALFITSFIGVAHFINLYQENKLFKPRYWINKSIGLAVIGFILGFCIGSPGWALNPQPYYDALLFDIRHMSSGHLGNFGLPFITHISYLLKTHTVFFIVFVVGVVYALIRHSKIHILILVGIFVPFVYVSQMTNKAFHYIIFILPPMSLLAGEALSVALDRIQKYKLSITALISIIFAFPVFGIIVSASSFKYCDSRIISGRWIQEHVPQGSVVVADYLMNIRSYVPRLLGTEQKEERLESDYREFYEKHIADMRAYNILPLKYDWEWLASVEADYLITSSYCFKRFFTTPVPEKNNPLHDEHISMLETYSNLFDESGKSSWKLAKEFCTGRGPHILIFERVIKK
ncbi:MAG: glycosyltransferase family 39 protein [Candidatus Auribacterota bacterium]|jgi:4-amino-4-deoxy-L-arabinose transferase-like glycosyltransferase|nr:glycosyltransferase family 39 protein [Candidatus Auribacterota bacterium]